MIATKYCMTADRLNMGDFELTKILNNDPEIKKIWLLGHFRKDPTDNKVVLIMSRTEFEEGVVRQWFNSAGDLGKPEKRGRDV